MKYPSLTTAVLSLVIGAFAWFVRAADSASAKPNIFFILADDLGYVDIGSNNPKSFYETPNIDALAVATVYGRNESRALAQGDSHVRGPLFRHYPHDGNQGGAPGGVVRDGDWKLIEWYEGGVELYNLAHDVEEKHNLTAGNSAKLEELQAKLAVWRKEVGAILPVPNPAYPLGDQAKPH